MRAKFALTAFLISCFGAILLGARIQSATAEEQSNDLIHQAEAAYQSGNFANAISKYKQALESGIENGHVFYNLGNAEYRAQNIGRAIASYRRALLYLPADPDILLNLNLARKETQDRLDNSPVSILDTVVRAFPPLTSTLRDWTFIVMYLGAWLLLLGSSLASPFRNNAGVLRTSGWGMLVLAGLFGVIAYGGRPGRDGALRWSIPLTVPKETPAVVVTREAKLYSGNGESYQIVFLLHEGAEILTGESRGDWTETLLPDGRKGWLRTDNVDILAP